VISYGYNGLGDRLQQVSGGVTTRYVLDLNNSLAQVLSDGSSTYLYGLDRIAQQNIVGWQYYQQDALGSVRQLVNAAGTVIQSRSYEPFGKQFGVAGNPLTKYGFTGEWTDPTNLIYLRARYYDPATGRFLSKDPVRGFASLPQTLNPYTYAVNNPLRYTDPSGEFIDVALDIAFISIDIYTLVNHWNTGCGNISSDLLALGLDVVGALLPFATGLGMVARVGSRVDDLGDAIKFVKHHTIPREILNFLPPDVTKLVRGKKGSPNIWKIPEDIHKWIHKGPGGGRYNARWLEEIAKLGPGEITPQKIHLIRDLLIEEFGLGGFRP
jgi:RHS repeat-associated protein